MQSGMESIKESAANVAASAKAGMEKTKATVQEKVEKMAAHNPVEKEIAAEKKHDRIRNAELNKQEAREHNAATKQAAKATGHGTGPTTPGTATYSTTGAHGYTAGTAPMSAMPGQGTGQPVAHVTEGVVESHPIGTHTGTGRTTTAHNTHVGGAGTGYTTGGGYS